MDKQRFDDLTRALAEGGATRRNAFRVLTGGALAAAGVTSLADATGKAKGDGQVKTQGSGGQRNKKRTCILPGRTCELKVKKGAPERLQNRDCKRCCGSSFTQLSVRKGRCCNHNGVLCGTTLQCCLGVCTDGTCQNDVIVLPPPPPTCNQKPPEAPCLNNQECCAETTKYICGTSHGSGSNTCCGSLGAACGSTLSCCIAYMCEGGQCGGPGV